MAMSKAERKLRGSVAAHTSWAKTDDRSARTAPARQKWRDSFADQVDPDHKLPEAERVRRGEHAYKAHMQRLALASAKARRLRAGAGVDPIEAA